MLPLSAHFLLRFIAFPNICELHSLKSDTVYLWLLTLKELPDRQNTVALGLLSTKWIKICYQHLHFHLMWDDVNSANLWTKVNFDITQFSNIFQYLLKVKLFSLLSVVHAINAFSPLLNLRSPDSSGIISLYSFPEYLRNNGSFTEPLEVLFSWVWILIEHSEKDFIFKYYIQSQC